MQPDEIVGYWIEWVHEQNSCETMVHMIGPDGAWHHCAVGRGARATDTPTADMVEYLQNDPRTTSVAAILNEHMPKDYGSLQVILDLNHDEQADIRHAYELLTEHHLL
jgi:hypothetical protein